MPRSYLIIDGYNLMHAAGMARLQYGPGDMERCRTQLLNCLSVQLSAAERERTTVVFDAADAPPGLERTATHAGMSILFAPRGGDADSTIEELVAAHSAPRQIRLVSSDHRLQKAARRRRAKFVDSERFFARLESRSQATEDARRSAAAVPAKKISGTVSQAEMSEWLEVFGDIPEAAELKSAAERLQDEMDELLNDSDAQHD